MKRIKKRVFEIISKAEKGDTVSAVFDWLIMVLIALSILMIILESFLAFRIRYGGFFRTFETSTVVIFAIEYVLRIWTADLLYPESKHPYIKFIFSFLAIIDLIAILPFFLPFVSADLRFLRVVRLSRLLRLMRVFKFGRYFDALMTIVKVIKASGPQLIMSVALCFFVMLVSAIVMYEVENPVQPEQFPNVIASLWWAMCTLTTVGYGDVYPITPVGKFLASLISLVGIGIIAIPTGIIAAGFNRAIHGEEEEDIEAMTEEELLLLQARVSGKLAEHGYQTSITIGKRKKDEDSPENPAGDSSGTEPEAQEQPGGDQP